MDDLVDDIIIFLITNYFNLQTIKSFLLTSKRMIKFKDQYVVKIHIIKELLGNQGIELFHVINKLYPNTKNLLIPTNSQVIFELINFLSLLQVDFRRCKHVDILKKSLEDYINTINVHIIIMDPRILEGQTIKNVNNVLIYNNHKGFSMHRRQIIHKSNNIRHIDSGKINCIDIGDKGDETYGYLKLFS
ncbi:hypothetical protein Klosneuvirus_3_245 [Klosneuvirus KNV1]|uniref:Uncharacterized protein n=1 Tax=Klosneuvirus KNV1 TaxID=1977640 RepID=A0A1V0SK52_9VIRU|nr:hypothetical protein Klosneuvirus_3_245 [Klosneuvirus KNV1]